MRPDFQYLLIVLTVNQIRTELMSHQNKIEALFRDIFALNVSFELYSKNYRDLYYNLLDIKI